jgi:adenine/guanine phosphoribosyltransferase-like PRPP-binding protein
MIGQALARELGVSLMILEVEKDGEKRVVAVKPRKGFEAESRKLGRVVIVDDTVKEGHTMRACIKYVKEEAEIVVVAAVCLFDNREHKTPVVARGVQLIAWR